MQYMKKRLLFIIYFILLKRNRRKVWWVIIFFFKHKCQHICKEGIKNVWKGCGKRITKTNKKKILRREESGLQSELYQSEAQRGERGKRWSIGWRWRRACRLVLHVWGDRRRKHHCPASHHQPRENTYRQGQDVTYTPTDSLTVLLIYQVVKVSALEVICHIHFGSILVFSDDLFVHKIIIILRVSELSDKLEKSFTS